MRSCIILAATFAVLGAASPLRTHPGSSDDTNYQGSETNLQSQYYPEDGAGKTGNYGGANTYGSGAGSGASSQRGYGDNDEEDSDDQQDFSQGLSGASKYDGEESGSQLVNSNRESLPSYTTQNQLPSEDEESQFQDNTYPSKRTGLNLKQGSNYRKRSLLKRSPAPQEDEDESETSQEGGGEGLQSEGLAAKQSSQSKHLPQSINNGDNYNNDNEVDLENNGRKSNNFDDSDGSDSEFVGGDNESGEGEQ